MLRGLYLAASIYVLVCGGLATRAWWTARVSAARPASGSHGRASVPMPRATRASAWFERVKVACNTLEVETRLASDPPPEGPEGSGYGAACFLLAGKVEKARNLIEQLRMDERHDAARVVFALGHSVADSGDERSAAPFLRLSIEYDTTNALAFYHLGMAEASLGQTDPARDHLLRFLELHREDDLTRRHALQQVSVLERR